jgi:hypothetical protein
MTSHILPEQKYVGDGVYASFDGYQIWLSVNGPDNNVVALDPQTFVGLVDYKEYVINFYRSRDEEI